MNSNIPVTSACNMTVANFLTQFSDEGIEVKLPIDELGLIKNIQTLDAKGGESGKGEVITEMPVDKDAWFFRCHFPKDPIMPGCLGIEGMWQSIALLLAANGHYGDLRALGIGDVKFMGEIRPDAKMVTFKVSIDKCKVNKKMVMAVARGSVSVDGTEIYRADKLKVGVIF